MTTPEQKAKELVGKIFSEQHIDDSAKLIGISSKKIALICVQEILSLHMIYAMGRDEKYSEGEFWQQVKKEIENL